jgi:hypothetical protein
LALGRQGSKDATVTGLLPLSGEPSLQPGHSLRKVGMRGSQPRPPTAEPFLASGRHVRWPRDLLPEPELGRKEGSPRRRGGDRLERPTTPQSPFRFFFLPCQRRKLSPRFQSVKRALSFCTVHSGREGDPCAATAPAAGLGARGPRGGHPSVSRYLLAVRPRARLRAPPPSSVSVHVPPASLLPRNYFARPVAPSIIKHQPVGRPCPAAFFWPAGYWRLMTLSA